MNYFFSIFFLVLSSSLGAMVQKFALPFEPAHKKPRLEEKDPLHQQLLDLKKQRLNVFLDTERIFKKGMYESNGKQILLNEPAKPYACYVDNQNFLIEKSADTEELTAPAAPREKGLGVLVLWQDTLEAAQTLSTQYPDEKIAIVSFANEHYPGGGFRHGARGQEEHLVRASNLLRSFELLKKKGVNFPDGERKRHIPPCGVIFHPDVTIFKDKNYQLIDKPYTINIISCAAYNLSSKNIPKTFKGTPEYTQNTRHKIRAQFLAAAHSDVKHLVLGAFGCGNFENDAEFIAQEYKIAIDEFGRYFKTITFAIVDEKGNNNFFVFDNMFKEKVL